MSNPPVQQVARVESIDMLKTNNGIFFTFVGKQEGVLWDTYHSVAEYFQPYGFFYATSGDIAEKHFDIDTVPSILVYKEKSHFYFPCMFCVVRPFFDCRFHFLFFFLPLPDCSVEQFSWSWGFTSERDVAQMGQRRTIFTLPEGERVRGSIRCERTNQNKKCFSRFLS